MPHLEAQLAAALSYSLTIFFFFGDAFGVVWSSKGGGTATSTSSRLVVEINCIFSALATDCDNSISPFQLILTEKSEVNFFSSFIPATISMLSSTRRIYGRRRAKHATRIFRTHKSYIGFQIFIVY